MEKRVQDYTQDILAVVRSNTSPAAMSDKLGDFHANDIADAMPRLTVQERCKLYRILELDMLSDIFEYTDSDNAAEYVKEMDVKKGAAILSRMETDALVEVLHKIDKAKKKLLFELMDDDVRHDIEMIASFDEDEIGSRMTTNCIIIRENLTVKQAMNSLVEQAAKNDNISTIFVRYCLTNHIQKAVSVIPFRYGFFLSVQKFMIVKRSACCSSVTPPASPTWWESPHCSVQYTTAHRTRL